MSNIKDNAAICEAKARAERVQSALTRFGVKIPHGQALEVIAAVFGHHNWHAYRADLLKQDQQRAEGVVSTEELDALAATLGFSSEDLSNINALGGPEFSARAMEERWAPREPVLLQASVYYGPPGKAEPLQQLATQTVLTRNVYAFCESLEAQYRPMYPNSPEGVLQVYSEPLARPEEPSVAQMADWLTREGVDPEQLRSMAGVLAKSAATRRAGVRLAELSPQGFLGHVAFMLESLACWTVFVDRMRKEFKLNSWPFECGQV